MPLISFYFYAPAVPLMPNLSLLCLLSIITHRYPTSRRVRVHVHIVAIAIATKSPKVISRARCCVCLASRPQSSVPKFPPRPPSAPPSRTVVDLAIPVFPSRSFGQASGKQLDGGHVVSELRPLFSCSRGCSMAGAGDCAGHSSLSRAEWWNPLASFFGGSLF